MRMLVPAPYQAPAKKDKKKKTKEAQGDLHPEETLGAVSEGIEAPSSGEEDEDEEEEEEEAESDSPLKGRKKKRAASTDPEEEASKRGKMALSDCMDSEAEPIPKRLPKAKPLAES